MASALRTIPCKEVARVWRLVGEEVGAQLSRGRGVRIEDGLSLIGRNGSVAIAEQAHRLSYEPVRSCLSRLEAAACVRHVVAELKKRARRRISTELFLRPVGVLYAAKDGKIALSVYEDFEKRLVKKETTFSRKKMPPPPPYSSCVGKKKRANEEQPTFQNVRFKLVQRYGADALCVLGRTLSVWDGDVKTTMEELGIQLTPPEHALFSREECDDVEKALAVSSAYSLERRQVIERAWRELCVSKSRVDDSKIKGARPEGGVVEIEYIPLAFLERRCTGCCRWLKPSMAEDQAIARLLCHLEPAGSPPTVSRQNWRNAHLRLSAAFEKKDEDFAVWLLRLWGLADTTTTKKKRIETNFTPKAPSVAWPIAAEPAGVVLEDDGYLRDEDETVSLPHHSEESSELLNEDEDDDPTARLDAFVALRPMIYSPSCDFAEFCSRLDVGCLSVPTSLLIDDAVRRIERRARSLGIGGGRWSAFDDLNRMLSAATGDSEKTNLKPLHERFVAIFGRSQDQIRADFGPFAPLVPATEALYRSATSSNGNMKAMGLSAFRHFLNTTLCLGLGAKQVNDIFDAVASDENEKISVGDVLVAMRRAAPSRPHRSVAVGRLHAMLRSRAGGVDPLVEKAPLLFRKTGTKLTVSRREFQEEHDLLYGLTIDADLDFYDRLRSVWEDVEDWSTVASALFPGRGQYLN